MMDWPSLPAETVVRERPVNLAGGDQPLFAHEFERSFPPTTIRTGDWDSIPEGLLLAPRSSRIDRDWFQAGIPSGLSGLKVRIKGWMARMWPRVAGPSDGIPLIITDEFSNGYFHWLTDGLPKLWWLRAHLQHVCLILPSFAAQYRYMAETLKPWPELKTEVLNPRTRTVLSGAVLVPPLAPTGNYRPLLIQGLAEAWRQAVSPAPPYRKIYVSRAKAPWRKIRNEDQVWAVLQARDFERVFLEDLAFADQVKMLAETRVLVSNHGAGLTNLMFQTPGSHVVEIRLRGDAANNCYYSLASAAGVGYRYLLADAAERNSDSHTADLLVDTAALERVLEDLI